MLNHAYHLPKTFKKWLILGNIHLQGEFGRASTVMILFEEIVFQP